MIDVVFQSQERKIGQNQTFLLLKKQSLEPFEFISGFMKCTEIHHHIPVGAHMLCHTKRFMRVYEVRLSVKLKHRKQ